MSGNAALEGQSAQEYQNGGSDRATAGLRLLARLIARRIIRAAPRGAELRCPQTPQGDGRWSAASDESASKESSGEGLTA